MKPYLLVLLLLSLICSACAGPLVPGKTPAPEASPTPENKATLTALPTVETTRSPERPTTLRIWLPPQFDPADGSSAGDLLQSRLVEFSGLHHGVRIEARVKALNGPGGLLDSLSAANAAAPLAMPDLILLPRALLETAALKGLLYPVDGLATTLNEDDWFAYAQQLARLQNSTFGLPFAGDSLVLLYRPIDIDPPPKDWPTALTLSQPMIFPAANDQALFTLAQYLATGASIQDAEGRPVLDSSTLQEVLTFYQEAETTGLMPFWLTQFATDDQAWEAYTENQSNMIVTWTSRYLRDLPGDTSATAIPTLAGETFTLADGWVWALSTPQSERQALGVALAEFLTGGDFLARWTAAAGYLPPRASALAGWSNTTLRRLVNLVVPSAQIFPANDMLAVIGPALQKATVEVLKEQTDPKTAAQQALDSLAAP